MINVVVSGCNGAMGRVLTKAIEEMEDMTIVCLLYTSDAADE